MSVLPIRTRHRHPARRPSGDVLVAGHGVTVRRDGKPLLDDVSLTVRAGELIAIVGPNGAGKSTLLSVLSGDSRPDSGTVTLFGGDGSTWSDVEAAMRRAVLLQQVTVSFPFTVAEIVAMGRAPWISTPCEDHDQAAISSAISIADVGHLTDRRFNTLSGGEQARVALARVLAQRAQLTFLDEPTAALDLRHEEIVLRAMCAQAAADDAVVVVLHDLNLAAAYADRMVLLADGRIAADGSPAEVCESSLLSSVYQYPIEIIQHPDGSTPIVVPRRRHGS